MLALLLERLEYDAADGAFCLGLYGDPAARPALEKMLAEIPSEDKEEVELRREISHAIEQLDPPAPTYVQPSLRHSVRVSGDAMPAFDLLPEAERLEMLGPRIRKFAPARRTASSTRAEREVEGGVAGTREVGSDATVRARAWEALADVAEDRCDPDAMIAVLNDPSREIEERGGAAVGLYAWPIATTSRAGSRALYEMGGKARVKALEAMWRSL